MVGHHDVHGVFDVDIGPEDASVSVVPVELLLVEIERSQVFRPAEIQLESARGFLGAGATPLVVALEPESLGHRGRVEVPLAHRRDGNGHRRQPPVDQVEVVGGLVDHQSAR